MAEPLFGVSCLKCISFFQCKTFSIQTESISQQRFLQMHRYVTCPFRHFLVEPDEPKLHCFLSLSAYPTIQLFSPSVLHVYWSKQNESQDGHIEVSRDWSRWHSTKGERLSKRTALSFFFLSLNTMLGSSTVPDAVLCTHRWEGQGCKEHDEVENLFFVLTAREKTWDREKRSPSICPRSFRQPPSCQKPGAAAKLIGEREERGGAGSTDQAIQLRFDQWSGAVGGSSPSSPLYLPQFPPPYFSPYQSSRTCRQRWPPLALHCQRMMQQRHRRWPPPCTEGGGVTGAK